MTQEQRIQVAVSLLVPIVTAVLGVLSLAVGDWRQRRTQAGRRKLAFEDASRQVSFAAAWWSARKLLADTPEAEHEATTRAMAWLEEASALVAASHSPSLNEKQGLTLRHLLLLYPLRRRAASIIRGVFWLCLGLVPIWVGGAMHNIFQPGGIATEYLYGDLVVIVVLIILALGLRSWARHVEKASRERRKRRPVTLRNAMLLYRFDQPMASLVRILFYASILSLIVIFLGFAASVREQPNYLPGDAVQFLTFVGYAVVLRYWAASLAKRENANANPARQSATIADHG